MREPKLSHTFYSRLPVTDAGVGVPAWFWRRLLAGFVWFVPLDTDAGVGVPAWFWRRLLAGFVWFVPLDTDAGVGVPAWIWRRLLAGFVWFVPLDTDAGVGVPAWIWRGLPELPGDIPGRGLVLRVIKQLLSRAKFNQTPRLTSGL